MDNNALDALIPIFMFLVIGAITISAFVLQYQKRRLESSEIIAAIEKGVEIKFPEKPKKSKLLPGLIWTLVGIVETIALAVGLPADAPSGIWLWGLVPVAVGIAYLIVYRLEEQVGDSKFD